MGRDDNQQADGLSVSDRSNDDVDSQPSIASEPPKTRRYPDPEELRRGTFEIGDLPDDRLRLLFPLGMPRDVKRVRVLLPGKNFGSKYKDFTVELFGVEGEIPAEILSQPPLEGYKTSPGWKVKVIPDFGSQELEKESGVPSPGGYLVFHDEDGQRIGMHIWWRRVLMRYINPYIDETWNPKTGWKRMIVHVEGALPEELAKQVKRLSDGLMLPIIVEHQMLSGEPLSRTRYTNEEFRELAIKATKQLAQANREFSPQNLADKLNFCRQSIHTYLNAAPGLRTELRRIHLEARLSSE